MTIRPNFFVAGTAALAGMPSFLRRTTAESVKEYVTIQSYCDFGLLTNRTNLLIECSVYASMFCQEKRTEGPTNETSRPTSDTYPL
jgi:hypothetical protein